jgi:hypothetical protein
MHSVSRRYNGEGTRHTPGGALKKLERSAMSSGSANKVNVKPANTKSIFDSFPPVSGMAYEENLTLIIGSGDDA